MGDSALDITNDPLAIDGMEDVFAQTVHRVIDNTDDSVHTVGTGGDLWTLNQAAEQLKVSLVTVRRRLQTGKLKGFKIEGLNGPEWRIVPPHQMACTVDDQTVQGVIDNTDHSVHTVGDHPDQVLISEHLDVIREMQAKLEALTYRNGYLEAQLENRDSQIKLLTDTQHKRGWWTSFCSWFLGVNQG